MAIVKIVPKEDWEIIKKYFSQGMGVVLIPDEARDAYFPAAMAEAFRKKNNTEVDYDFGGDPDFFVDIMSTPLHYAVTEIMGTDTNHTES